MKPHHLLPVLLVGLLSVAAAAGERFTVTVTHDLETARPDEVIVLSYAEVRARLTDWRFDHVQVRRADTGEVVPAQITNFTPNVRPATYDDLVWQHDFAAGEKSATFWIESTPDPVPPFPARVFARHVPERLDDFAWENDRMAHRAYGARLNTAEAGSSQLRSSGLDFWAKRVRYPIVDRWYLKGHDAYHLDSGEGLDFYSVGSNSGVGGTAVWQDGVAHTAGNWTTARVLANGPIRAVFELDYAPIDLGNGVTVTETKRFTVDAGHHFDRIDSRFEVVGTSRVDVAVGLTKRTDLEPGRVQAPADDLLKAGFNLLSNWTTYPDGLGDLATAVIMALQGDVEKVSDATNDYLVTWMYADADRPEWASSTLTYWAGGVWSESGDLPARVDWSAFLLDHNFRYQSPVTVTLDPVE